jgi:hypothetical protein
MLTAIFEQVSIGLFTFVMLAANFVFYIEKIVPHSENIIDLKNMIIYPKERKVCVDLHSVLIK